MQWIVKIVNFTHTYKPLGMNKQDLSVEWELNKNQWMVKRMWHGMGTIYERIETKCVQYNKFIKKKYQAQIWKIFQKCDIWKTNFSCISKKKLKNKMLFSKLLNDKFIFCCQFVQIFCVICANIFWTYTTANQIVITILLPVQNVTRKSKVNEILNWNE